MIFNIEEIDDIQEEVSKNWDFNESYGKVNDFSSIGLLIFSWTYIEPGSGGPITRSLRAERGSSRSNYGGKV